MGGRCTSEKLSTVLMPFSAESVRTGGEGGNRTIPTGGQAR